MPTKTLCEIEREHILATLCSNGGDKVRTAQQLGVSLKTIFTTN